MDDVQTYNDYMKDRVLQSLSIVASSLLWLGLHP
jgi:hypothetical protein